MLLVIAAAASAAILISGEDKRPSGKAEEALGPAALQGKSPVQQPSTLSQRAAVSPASGARAKMPGIQWETDLQRALTRAGREGKQVVIDFYAEWCGFCKKMDQETYPDPGVISLVNQRSVAVRIDAERNPELAGKYGVAGFPTLLLVNSAGKEVGRLVGFMPAEDFRKELSRILHGAAAG